MGDPFRDHALPRGPLLGAAILIGVTIVAAGAVRLTGVGSSRVADAPTATERAFRFEDRSDGGISVFDAASEREVDQVAPGTNGFLRGTLRGLARERKRQGIGPEAPFRLIAHVDGRLTLVDPATGRRVDLESFGPTNAAVFYRLLVADGGAR